MSKNSNITVAIVKKMNKPKTDVKLPVRVKTSVYINVEIWTDFKNLTAKPRGQTSELLEAFMAQYVRLNKRR